ncbi:hypothetical protein WK92_09975 [Burkholderia ubonensis]|nr:hypothetical protein WK82_11330 [Burkholderia ubonensis]KVW24734.1 hypothetical protein WK92_09975 [Burkholderia ubonensis]
MKFEITTAGYARATQLCLDRGATRIEIRAPLLKRKQMRDPIASDSLDVFRVNCARDKRIEQIEYNHLRIDLVYPVEQKCGIDRRGGWIHFHLFTLQ